MTHKELLDKISVEAGLTKVQTRNVIDLLIAELKAQTAETGEFTLFSVGSFKVADRPERKGRNPQNGEDITIPASKKVKFKAAKAFKDLL